MRFNGIGISLREVRRGMTDHDVSIADTLVSRINGTPRLSNIVDGIGTDMIPIAYQYVNHTHCIPESLESDLAGIAELYHLIDNFNYWDEKREHGVKTAILKGMVRTGLFNDSESIEGLKSLLTLTSNANEAYELSKTIPVFLKSDTKELKTLLSLYSSGQMQRSGFIWICYESIGVVSRDDGIRERVLSNDSRQLHLLNALKSIQKNELVPSTSEEWGCIMQSYHLLDEICPDPEQLYSDRQGTIVAMLECLIMLDTESRRKFADCINGMGTACEYPVPYDNMTYDLLRFLGCTVSNDRKRSMVNASDRICSLHITDAVSERLRALGPDGTNAYIGTMILMSANDYNTTECIQLESIMPALLDSVIFSDASLATIRMNWLYDVSVYLVKLLDHIDDGGAVFKSLSALFDAVGHGDNGPIMEAMGLPFAVWRMAVLAQTPDK